MIPNQTRAVLRPIIIGASATKHFCITCYDKLGRPYGEVIQ